MLLQLTAGRMGACARLTDESLQQMSPCSRRVPAADESLQLCRSSGYHPDMYPHVDASVVDGCPRHNLLAWGTWPIAPPTPPPPTPLLPHDLGWQQAAAARTAGAGFHNIVTQAAMTPQPAAQARTTCHNPTPLMGLLMWLRPHRRIRTHQAKAAA